MAKHRNVFTLATRYHAALPKRLRNYLNNRGIPDRIIDSHLLGWNGHRITIPVSNRNGELVFFKLAKDPEDKLPGPKMLVQRHTRVEIYGWKRILSKPQQ